MARETAVAVAMDRHDPQALHAALSEGGYLPEPDTFVPEDLYAQIAGMGINAVLPARAGDVTKIYLTKQTIRGSSYPAVTSSFFVDSVFDISQGRQAFERLQSGQQFGKIVVRIPE